MSQMCRLHPFLDLKACTQLDLVRKILTVTETCLDKDKWLQEFHDVFEGLGEMPGEYHIELKAGATPVIHLPRRIPLSLYDKLKHTLNNLENEGIVSKVDKPTDWVNSLVIVEKKNGSLRLFRSERFEQSS